MAVPPDSDDKVLHGEGGVKTKGWNALYQAQRNKGAKRKKLKKIRDFCSIYVTNRTYSKGEANIVRKEVTRFTKFRRRDVGALTLTGIPRGNGFAHFSCLLDTPRI